VEAAVAGDAAALEIVEQAASDLAQTAATAVRAVGVSTVAYTGKLFEAGPVLLEPFLAELARLVPGTELVAAQGDPLDGAERLATGPLGAYEPLVYVSGPEPRPADPELPFPRGSLIVSCQARADNPLHGPGPMVLMAQAALAGGAAAIRANGPADIAAIRAAVDLPVIGIFKQGSASGVSITPTKQAASDVVAAGAGIVALDGTLRPRPNGERLAEQIAHIHALGALAMADVDSLSAGIAAREAGADIVASTLSGYTGGGVQPGPDTALIAALTDALDCPIVAEGRYWTPSDVRAAFDLGAYAVVVGTAVTNPMAITKRLARAEP
jgi:N-acylglucosamine-6-phosphate 2-epimerase